MLSMRSKLLLIAMAVSVSAGCRHAPVLAPPKDLPAAIDPAEVFSLVPIPGMESGVVQFHEGNYLVQSAVPKSGGPEFNLYPVSGSGSGTPPTPRHSVVTYAGRMFSVHVYRDRGREQPHYGLVPMDVRGAITSTDTFVLARMPRSNGRKGAVVEFDRRLFVVKEMTEAAPGEAMVKLIPTISWWGAPPPPEHRIVTYRGAQFEVRAIYKRGEDASYGLYPLASASPSTEVLPQPTPGVPPADRSPPEGHRPPPPPAEERRPPNAEPTPSGAPSPSKPYNPAQTASRPIT